MNKITLQFSNHNIESEYNKNYCEVTSKGYIIGNILVTILLTIYLIFVLAEDKQNNNWREIIVVIIAILTQILALIMIKCYLQKFNYFNFFAGISISFLFVFFSNQGINEKETTQTMPNSSHTIFHTIGHTKAVYLFGILFNYFIGGTNLIIKVLHSIWTCLICYIFLGEKEFIDSALSVLLFVVMWLILVSKLYFDEKHSRMLFLDKVQAKTMIDLNKNVIKFFPQASFQVSYNSEQQLLELQNYSLSSQEQFKVSNTQTFIELANNLRIKSTPAKDVNKKKPQTMQFSTDVFQIMKFPSQQQPIQQQQVQVQQLQFSQQVEKQEERKKKISQQMDFKNNQQDEIKMNQEADPEQIINEQQDVSLLTVLYKIFAIFHLKQNLFLKKDQADLEKQLNQNDEIQQIAVQKNYRQLHVFQNDEKSGKIIELVVSLFIYEICQTDRLQLNCLMFFQQKQHDRGLNKILNLCQANAKIQKSFTTKLQIELNEDYSRSQNNGKVDKQQLSTQQNSTKKKFYILKNLQIAQQYFSEHFIDFQNKHFQKNQIFNKEANNNYFIEDLNDTSRNTVISFASLFRQTLSDLREKFNKKQIDILVDSSLKKNAEEMKVSKNQDKYKMIIHNVLIFLSKQQKKSFQIKVKLEQNEQLTRLFFINKNNMQTQDEVQVQIHNTKYLIKDGNLNFTLAKFAIKQINPKNYITTVMYDNQYPNSSERHKYKQNLQQIVLNFQSQEFIGNNMQNSQEEQKSNDSIHMSEVEFKKETNQNKQIITQSFKDETFKNKITIEHQLLSNSEIIDSRENYFYSDDNDQIEQSCNKRVQKVKDFHNTYFKDRE